MLQSSSGRLEHSVKISKRLQVIYQAQVGNRQPSLHILSNLPLEVSPCSVSTKHLATTTVNSTIVIAGSCQKH